MKQKNTLKTKSIRIKELLDKKIEKEDSLLRLKKTEVKESLSYIYNLFVEKYRDVVAEHRETVEAAQLRKQKFFMIEEKEWLNTEEHLKSFERKIFWIVYTMLNSIQISTTKFLYYFEDRGNYFGNGTDKKYIDSEIKTLQKHLTTINKYVIERDRFLKKSSILYRMKELNRVELIFTYLINQKGPLKNKNSFYVSKLYNHFENIVETFEEEK